MTVSTSGFGQNARLFTLAAHGLRAAVTDFGAALVALYHSDGTNVVLGLPGGEAYAADSQFMGVIAGRYANRIARGRFSLAGQEWQLPCNDGRNHLHGGPDGFARRLWQASVDDAATKVRFSLVSPHLDQGYPGQLEVSVTYEITAQGCLRLTMQASADRPAIVNLAPHGYFNLAGQGGAGDHMLRLHAGRYTPVDEEMIPLGEICDVAGTAYDYRTARAIDPAIDMNFAVDGPTGVLRPVAEAWDPASARQLEVRATAPGVQVYGGAHLAGGGAYPAHAGFCIEPQYFPDSPNQPAFAAPVIGPDMSYIEMVEYELGQHRARE